MKVSQWTSSYNAQFRNDDVISPNAGEPMHHFPGCYDPSHYQRDPGFYGTRASLAATAKLDATQSGLNVRVPQPGSNVGYGSAPAKARTSGLSQSFYAPPPDPSTQNYSALRQSGSSALNTQRVGGEPVQDGTGSFGASQNGSTSARGAPQSLANGQNLWTAPIVPHGDRSSYSAARGPTLASPPTQRSGAQGNGFGATNYNASGSFSSSQQRGLVDTAFVDGPDEWRYDARGSAMTKEVELRRNTDPRNKYHIPGYQGFVRGKQFLHGDTFGKITRNCLDIPLDQPTDID
jgi:hypothetical protein